jgi:uncharacterized membrane protein
VRLGFIFPEFLWLLLLLPPLAVLAIVTPRRLSRWRFWLSLGLRMLALLSLVLGLSGAQIVWPVGVVSTVFLLDGSDSVALSQRARAETFVQQALAQMPPDDRAAIVVFGQRALVERAPSDNRVLGQVVAQPGGNGTNIEDAIQLGLALLPNEGYKRLVLLSDGGANLGDTLAAAQRATASRVPIDVVTLTGLADGLDAQITRLDVPSSAREGQRLRMKVEIESNSATSGRLLVTDANGATLSDVQVELVQGAQTFELTLPEAVPYFNRYVVRLEVPNDARLQNNRAEAYTFVSGPPRVMLVEGSEGAASNLAEALRVAQFEVEVVRPDQIPNNVADLSSYDAVALIDVPQRAVSARAQTALSSFVHDFGRGLLMVGGPQSFGAGSWRDTAVEAALPVSMDIPSEVQFPPASIVVLIDSSGSMGVSENGRTKLSLAAEGAQRIASLMRDQDDLTVIAFDSEINAQIGPVEGTQRDEAIVALDRWRSPGGGGINMFDGMTEAAKRIRASEKPVRHIITITDGSDTVQQEGVLELVRQLNEEKVTVTTIAVGDGSHVPFIRDVAQVGGGRTFLTDQAANLPNILVNETQVVLQPYVIEEPFTPVGGAPHPILRGIMQVPAFQGFVVTTPRQSAQVLLATPRGDPLLATWQYGLGRAAAWTSDLKGQWARDWVSSPEFPRFSAQLLSWLLPARDSQQLTMQASTSGDVLVLEALAQDAMGRAQSGLLVRGMLLGGDNNTIEVQLREVGPGQYRATVSDARPGAYLVQLVAQDAQNQAFGAVTGGAVVPLSNEYHSQTANPGLLEEITRLTNGRVNPQPERVFDVSGMSTGAVQEIAWPLLWLALLLLPFDVALRRLFWRGMSGVAVQTQPASAPAPKPKPAQRAQPKPKPQQSKANERLEQLREAQERARRRARGEE